MRNQSVTSLLSRYQRCGLLRVLALVLVMALGIATPPAASANPPAQANLGNSVDAHRCQKGGWEDLARSESPMTAFANQDECVSYAAEGGVIVPLMVSYLTLGWVSPIGTVTGAGLQPGAPLMMHLKFLEVYGGGILDYQWYGVTVTPTGEIYTQILQVCGVYEELYFYTIDAQGNVITTTPTAAPC